MDSRISRRSVLVGVGGVGLVGCAGLPKAIGGSDGVARRVAREFVSRPEISMYHVDDVHAVHYAEAATAYGAARLAGRIGDTELLKAVAARHERVLDEGLPNTRNHVDANVYGVWTLELYLQTGDTDALAYGLELADGQWVETDARGLTRQARFWIDDIWMIGALQAQAFRATGQRVYAERAGLMAEIYIERLQQPNGLFHHGPEAPFFWGRGNGWVAAGLAEVLSVLPADSPHHAPVKAGFDRMIDILEPYRAESGLWRQLIDKPYSWEESSGSAMFGFAFASAGQRALAAETWEALTPRIGPDGRLSGVCVGTGQSLDEQYYLDRPTVTGDLHGQAPLLWLANALAV